MTITGIIPQLRTTDLDASIRFYTDMLGMTLDFRYQDFYAGISAGNHCFHLKLVDDKDPSIDHVAEGGHVHLYLETDDVHGMADTLKQRGLSLAEGVHDTAWSTREFIVRDDQGHTLYFSQPL